MHVGCFSMFLELIKYCLSCVANIRRVPTFECMSYNAVCVVLMIEDQDIFMSSEGCDGKFFRLVGRGFANFVCCHELTHDIVCFIIMRFLYRFNVYQVLLDMPG